MPNGDAGFEGGDKKRQRNALAVSRPMQSNNLHTYGLPTSVRDVDNAKSNARMMKVMVVEPAETQTALHALTSGFEAHMLSCIC